MKYSDDDREKYVDGLVECLKKNKRRRQLSENRMKIKRMNGPTRGGMILTTPDAAVTERERDRRVGVVVGRQVERSGDSGAEETGGQKIR